MFFPSILLISLLGAAKAGSPYWYDAPQTWTNRTLMVHLYEWKWPDIANECETFLQYYGYGAVQVSPPQEHIMIDQGTNCPWWIRYQPVSYKLDSRSGNEAEFRDMVDRCNKVGVRIVVDVVSNHMVIVDQKRNDPGIWSSGSSDFNGYDGVEQFPGVPYGPGDFHDYACHTNISDSDYTQNADNVRNCRLNGLLDLNHASPYVRSMISNYLNKFIDMGVAGFRFDAAKHMYPVDLESILTSVRNLRDDIFGPNQRPFAVHEVIDRGGEAIKLGEYTNFGRYTNFNFGPAVSNCINRYDDIRNLVYMGPGYGGYGNNEDHDALNFIDNHDNQRDDNPAVLTYKAGDSYRLAVSYMLAWSYGYPRVMSSYYFDYRDQGPPNLGKDSGYKTSSPSFNPDQTCDAASGFVCEHRWPTIRQMAVFHSTVEGAAAEELVTDINRMAFARYQKGFFAMNNNDYRWDNTFQTTLPAGQYCDHYNGNGAEGAAAGQCTGQTITVDANGKTTLSIEYHQAVAISLASFVGVPPPPSKPDESNYQTTVIFMKADTQLGQNLFVRGGAPRGKQCAAGPYQQESDPCVVPIAHNTTTSFIFAEYLTWSQGDNYLDFEGPEVEQGTHDGASAAGTPTIYTSNDPNAPEYQPYNKYGVGYWMVQLLMDCSKTDGGFFELKGFLSDWEQDVQQKRCSGSIGGAPPFSSGNHIGRCGAVNVFIWGDPSCIIDGL